MFFGKGVHLPASETVLVTPALLILTISTTKVEAIMQFSLFNKKTVSCVLSRNWMPACRFPQNTAFFPTSRGQGKKDRRYGA